MEFINESPPPEARKDINLLPASDSVAGQPNPPEETAIRDPRLAEQHARTVGEVAESAAIHEALGAEQHPAEIYKPEIDRDYEAHKALDNIYTEVLRYFKETLRFEHTSAASRKNTPSSVSPRRIIVNIQEFVDKIIDVPSTAIKHNIEYLENTHFRFPGISSETDDYPSAIKRRCVSKIYESLTGFSDHELGLMSSFVEQTRGERPQAINNVEPGNVHYYRLDWVQPIKGLLLSTNLRTEQNYSIKYEPDELARSSYLTPGALVEIISKYEGQGNNFPLSPINERIKRKR